MENLREILIDEIIELAGDEYESKDDYLELAKKSNDDLVLQVIHIANYYKAREDIIPVDIFYYYDDNGNKVYDTEEMTKVFEKELDNLIKN